MKYLVFFFLLMLPWFQCHEVHCQNVKFDIIELINYLNTDDAHARIIGFDYLNKTVADENKAEVLKEIWELTEREKNGNAIRNSIVNYYISYPDNKRIWSKKIANHIISLSKNKDPLTRRLSLNALSTRSGDEEVRRTILHFLDDEDPLIRELALVQVSKWKDGRDILKDFIKKYKRDERMAESLMKARFFLKKL